MALAFKNELQVEAKAVKSEFSVRSSIIKSIEIYLKTILFDLFNYCGR